MVSSALPIPSSLSLPPVWRRLVRTSRFTATLLLLFAALFVVIFGLAFVDPRTLLGDPLWIKPLKFAISVPLYVGTLLWILSYVRGWRWLVRTVAVVSSTILLVELALIIMQAARGVRSHFNIATEFDAAIFSFMGMLILVLWVMSLAAVFLLLRQRMDDPVFAWSLRLALIITVIGAAQGGLMASPTTEQRAAMQRGETVLYSGAHSVGVEDGGPGLPLIGWSTAGGDLRVGHFVGLHALQIVPLIGAFINRRWRARLSTRRRTILLWLAAGGYLGVMLLLTWQALRGQPLLAPDAATLLALGALIATVALGSCLTVATDARQPVLK